MPGSRLRLLVAVLLAVVAVALELLPAAGAEGNLLGAAVSWTTYGYDLQRTGYNPSESTIGPSNAAWQDPWPPFVTP